MLRPSFVITDICSAEKGKQSRITDKKKIMPQQSAEKCRTKRQQLHVQFQLLPPQQKLKLGKKMKKEILKYFESLTTNSRKLIFKTY